MTSHELPGFVVPPSVALSGRMMSTMGFESPVPVVLVAYHTPGCSGVGSSAYLLAAVGPSVDSWPYYPIGGFTVGSEAIRFFEATDETPYRMEDSETLELDHELKFNRGLDWDVEDASSLIRLMLPLVKEKLELAEWDDVAAEQWVAACEGWPHFDQFMALDVEKLA